MSNRDRTSFRLKQALPRVMFSAHLALHVLLLIAVALFTCAAPSFACQDLTESEAPVEQEQSGKESVINQQARVRIAYRPPTMSLSVPMHEGLRFITRSAGAPQSGHRLHNNLLAPLRC